MPKAFEVRLTVIGQQMFPIAIHASTEAARTDWRRDPAALRYEFVTVPDTVTVGVWRYMHRTNLAYAGFDFVVTPDGEWVMLEINIGPPDRKDPCGGGQDLAGAPESVELARDH